QTSRGFITGRNQKSNKRTGDQCVESNARQHSATSPKHLHILERSLAYIRTLLMRGASVVREFRQGLTSRRSTREIHFRPPLDDMTGGASTAGCRDNSRSCNQFCTESEALLRNCNRSSSVSCG